MGTLDQFPHFSGAPIVEAVLNLQISPLSPDTTLGVLSSDFARAVEPDYPIKQTFGSITLSAGPSTATAGSQQTGFVFRSTDGRRALQARIDGFAFSQFAPYESWEPFVAEARRTWEVYRETVAAVEPTAIGMRTINSLSMPAGSTMESYLRVYPALPTDADFPQSVVNFAMRVDFQVEHGGKFQMQMGYLINTVPDRVTS